MSFYFGCVLFVFTLFCSSTIQAKPSGGSYIAAVVEYAPQSNPSLDAAQNIYNNVNNYLSFIHNASISKADIIVFPETGLIGHGNQVYYSEIPSVNESSTPCAHNTSSLALDELSCAARSYSIYVVVNLPEVYYNTSTNQTQHFNTDVVFDRNGTIIARYRKYNLFGERTTSVPDLEHVYFDTDFGVRFGVFICFDIDFREPAVSLVRDYGIRHFVYSLSWISELPFLTAIQSQWSWAYGLDVVLLASGYNNPNTGKSGSGIYQGRDGPLAYTMTDSRGSKMLLSVVSKNSYSMSNLLSNENKTESKSVSSDSNAIESNKMESTASNLKMLQDFIYLFRTELLRPPGGSPELHDDASAERSRNDTEIVTSLSVVTTLCQRSICCDFNINMTSTYEHNAGDYSNRGDDYNQYYYRMAVFDGVRTYSGFATAGVQLCSVIACVDDTLESCGLRADDVTAKPLTFTSDIYGSMIQTKIVFNNVQIDATFGDTDSLISPDILVSGTGDSFGALVPKSAFDYQTFPPYNESVYCELKSLKSFDNLITFGIYSRQFDRDGQPVTPSDISSSAVFKFNTTVLFSCFVLMISARRFSSFRL